MTKTQRDRKIAAACKRLVEARELLDAACEAFSDESYALTQDELAQWQGVARAHDFTVSAIRNAVVLTA